MLTDHNALPCPEIALHAVLHVHRITVTSYAVRQPGAVEWQSVRLERAARSEDVAAPIDRAV